MKEVAATEFARNFGQYREIVQREPIAVTSHGRATGYFVSPIEFEEMQRLKIATELRNRDQVLIMFLGSAGVPFLRPGLSSHRVAPASWVKPGRRPPRSGPGLRHEAGATMLA